jgi:hypothetical protein
MARFYAKFDSTIPDAPSGFGYELLRVSTGNTEGNALRTGLIASRSAVSTDIYEELDAQYQSGGRGTYFPPDLLQVTGGILTGSVYTSSFNGIAIPSDYSIRPTASVLSTNPIVVATIPLDSASVSNTTYLNASTAVRNVLDVIQTTGATITTPFTRQGDNPSRTLHSIWHDQNLRYFAWDDFTPGTVSASKNINGLNTAANPPEVTPGGTPVDTACQILYQLTLAEFTNDFNPDAKFELRIEIVTGSNSTILDLRTSGPHGGPLTLGTDSSGTGPANPHLGGNSTWTWTQSTKQLNWLLGLQTGSYSYNVLDSRVYDATITTHNRNTTGQASFGGTSTSTFVVKDGNSS